MQTSVRTIVRILCVLLLWGSVDLARAQDARDSDGLRVEPRLDDILEGVWRAAGLDVVHERHILDAVDRQSWLPSLRIGISLSYGLHARAIAGIGPVHYLPDFLRWGDPRVQWYRWSRVLGSYDRILFSEPGADPTRSERAGLQFALGCVLSWPLAPPRSSPSRIIATFEARRREVEETVMALQRDRTQARTEMHESRDLLARARQHLRLQALDAELGAIGRLRAVTLE